MLENRAKSLQLLIDFVFSNNLLELVMDKQGKKSQARQFYTVSNFSSATFTPKAVYNKPKQKNSVRKEGKNVMSMFSNIIPWSPRKPDRTPGEKTIEILQQPSFQAGGTLQTTAPEDLQQSTGMTHQLRFCFKVTMEHVLIGNENQLDLLLVSTNKSKQLKYEKLWDISIGHSIDLVNVDMKKCIIYIVSNSCSKLYIYRYANKTIKKMPKLVSKINLPTQVHNMYGIKQNLIICYDEFLEVYTVSNDDTVIKKLSEFYAIPQHLAKKVKYFVAPAPIQSTLNIFFEENEIEKESMFTLWVHQIEFMVNDAFMKGFKKVYDIQKRLKKKLVLKNFMKDTFLMNIGWEILAFKQGYIIDSVSISSKIHNSNLRYIGEEKLIHVSDRRLELYDFKISTDTKPFKLKISPIDSVHLSLPSDVQFIDLLQVYNGNLLLLFADRGNKAAAQTGQLKYWLAITQSISLNQKFDVFFGKRSLYNISTEELQGYFDMSRKMGVSQKDMFFQLWNRSDKKQDDFHFLLRTKDHGLITEQLKKILRKSSQAFTQVYKLIRNAFLTMKQELLYSQNPSRDMFFGYIQFSYLLKKLEYFRDVTLLERKMMPEEETEQAEQAENKKKKFTLNIKTFYQINEINVIETLVDLTKDLILNQKPVQHRIRIFLNTFKFTLRIVYKEVLAKIIESLGKDFSVLIQKIPQILPCQFNEEDKAAAEQRDNQFFEGIWGSMNTYEKQNAACFDRVITIDNRQMVIETMKDLNFRRSFLTTHCFIADCSEVIQKNFEYIQSEQIFYYVVKQVLKFVKNTNDRKVIFTLIQNMYYEKLTHLKNRINLYYQLYNYLQTKQIVPERDEEPLSFNQFLCLRDYEVFSIFFEIEKNRKGLILYEIKPIYEFNSKQGSDLFNQCLMEYFKNPISSLSDIKYLLNRINNEKKQFHINNQHMYQILTEAMTFKLMVGTGQDIPLKQVLIYIERVPMDKNSEYLSKLNFISIINQNIDIIQAAHVNMSIHEILFNPSQLIGKLCEYLIIELNVSHLQSEEETLKKSYNILAKIQHLHHQIYKSEQDPLFQILFIYIVKLSVDYHMFPHIKAIINDKFLLNEVNCTAEFISDVLGFYLFRSSMTENKIFMKNEKFLRGLISIFHEDSLIREFIICQFQFAKRLTSEEYQVQYPLSPKYGSPGSAQLETIIYHLKPDHILSLNIEELYQIMCRMKITYREILTSMDAIEEDQTHVLTTIIIESERPQITKKQIYEEFIYRLLSLKKIKECIPYIDKLLECEECSEDNDLILFPYLFLSELSENLNYEGRALFFKLSAFHFENPQKLFSIIKDYMLVPRNMKERSIFLRNEVQNCQQNQAKSLSKIKGNALLNSRLIQTAIKNGLEQNLYATLEKSYIHSTVSRNQFDHIMYGFIFIILIHQPYLIAKYIICSKKISVAKNIRLFMNFLAKESCFNPLALMQLGSRVFLAAFYSIKDEKEVSEVISQINTYELSHDLDPEFYNIEYDKSIDYLNKLYASSILFREEKRKKNRKMSLSVEDKDHCQDVSEENHYKKLLSPELIMQEKPISCSQNDTSEIGDEKTYVMDITKKTSFDKQNQMNKVLKKTNQKRRKGSAVIEKYDEFNMEAPSRGDLIHSNMAVTNSEEYNREDQIERHEQLSEPHIEIQEQVENNEEQEKDDEKQQRQVSLKEESKASQAHGSEKKMEDISDNNSAVPLIVVSYKRRESSQFGQIGQHQNIMKMPTPENHQKQKAKTFREGAAGLKPLTQRHKSKTSMKLDVGENINKVIRESSLHKADSGNLDQEENHLQFKDFFGISKNIKEANISEENSPMLNPGQMKEMKDILKDSVQESRDRDKSRGDYGSKSRSGKSTPSRNSSMSRPIQIKVYKRFNNIPLIEEMGLKIYRNNLLLIDNPKIKSFKISILTPYEKQPQFKEYAYELIRYLYKQTSETSLVGIMRLIAFLIDAFKLSINRVVLQIWVRAQNLSNKYQIGLNIRQIIPIEPIFDKEVDIFNIFYQAQRRIKPLLDDVNVFKISKMIALAFQESQFEHQILYTYLQKIAFTHHHHRKSSNQVVIEIDNPEETKFKAQEKIEGLAEKLPVSMICERMLTIYDKALPKYKEIVLRGMVNKVKRSGKYEQKLNVLSIAKEIDPNYEHTYQTLVKGR